MSSPFIQEVSINDNAYCIRQGSQFLYNHSKLPSSAGSWNRLQIGFDGSSDYGSFMIIGCFTAMPDWKAEGLTITQIKLTFNISSSNSFVNSLNLYKCNYKNITNKEDDDYVVSSSTHLGRHFLGDSLAGVIEPDTQDIREIIFSKTSYPEHFEQLLNYLVNDENKNIIFFDEGSKPSSSNYKQIGVNSITIEITYVNGIVYYGIDKSWKPCLVYYGINGKWQQVAPYYGKDGKWKPLGGG